MSHRTCGGCRCSDDPPYGEEESHADHLVCHATIGPVWMLFMMPIVLRHHGEETALNALMQASCARASFDCITWLFRFEIKAVSLAGTITASRDSFVSLTYYKPPGGLEQCPNTKITACELKITHKRAGATQTLSTQRRGAFEV